MSPAEGQDKRCFCLVVEGRVICQAVVDSESATHILDSGALTNPDPDQIFTGGQATGVCVILMW